MKEKNRTWGKWYLKGLAFLATGIFTSMAAGLSVMAQTELTFTEKLTIEEVRELSEPEKDYEDENGIRYELKHWEITGKRRGRDYPYPGKTGGISQGGSCRGGS